MTINVGDKIPSATLKQLTPEGVKEFTTDEIFRGKKVVLFAVPGAFTPACSQRHLPGYVDKAADIKAKGVDEIACVAVNDAFVMGAWGKEQRTEGKVRMLADGSGDFARALGLELDLTKGGLGVRSKRYAMLVDNGVVKSLSVEAQPGQVDASSADAMLKALSTGPYRYLPCLRRRCGRGKDDLILPACFGDTSARQRIGSFVFGMTGMTAYPNPGDVVRSRGGVEPLP